MVPALRGVSAKCRTMQRHENPPLALESMVVHQQGLGSLGDQNVVRSVIVWLS